MVSSKQFFLATSLLLSAVAAGTAPAAARTLNVATAERHAVNNFAIESRDLNNEESIAEAVAAPPPNKPKAAAAPPPNKPKAVAAPPPNKPKAVAAPPPNKPKAVAAPPPNKPTAVAAPPPKNAAPPKKCRPTKRDSLASKVLYEGHDANNVKENEYVGTLQIQANSNHATITDLTGCTALFFYMGTTLRRAVHILCGNEETDAKTATQAAGGADSVTIGASESKYHNNAVKGINAAKPNMIINNDSRIYSKKGANSGLAVTFRGATGSTAITEGEGPRVCLQTQ